MGSDCGIANVNIGTSGAEIGGAFGGEKKLAAEEKLVQTLGKPICEDRLIQLTGAKSCHLPKVLILIFDYNFNV